MSIRRKALLGMALLFLLNILLLGGYYTFYLRDEVSENLRKTQSNVEETARQAAESIASAETASIGSVLAADAFSRFDFTVTDVQTNEILYGSSAQSGDLDFNAVAVAKRNGRTLLVEATRYFYLGSIRELSLIRQVIAAEIIIMALILALIAVVLQSGILHPLAALNDRMSAYGEGKAVPASGSVRRDELGQLTRAFDRLVCALDEEKRMQGKIIASISHDIKTPLTSVMGYVERLQKGTIKDEERVRQYLQTIYDRARSIDALVCEFDDYLISNTQAIKCEPIDMNYLCDLIRAEYGDELAAEGARLRVENTAGGLALPGDLGKLRRVFGNLISNAVKHARADEQLEIEVFCERMGETVRFSVSDNGRGVPPEERQSIFEPFHTGNSARGGGSGLGLAICRSIVMAHGGEIEADASSTGGLRVVIIIPLHP